MPSLRPSAVLVCLLLAACASAPPPAAVGDAARPVLASDWVRTELYFGIGPEHGAGLDEDWRDFLDREVTARFPDGLTVLDAYGQWQGQGDTAPARLRSRVLLILHEDSAARDADIEALRAVWKRQTGHQSVLRVSQPAEVSF